MARVNAGGGGHYPDLAGRDGGSALAGLYDRHARELHRYLARRLDAATADDLVAETFLIAWQRRERYRPERGSARAWLYGIATNLYLPGVTVTPDARTTDGRARNEVLLDPATARLLEWRSVAIKANQNLTSDLRTEAVVAELGQRP
jgi:DNA-directed RNA polymerase specialized sigma24 family protein